MFKVFGIFYQYLVVVNLFQCNVRLVIDDIGQQVGVWIVYFIEYLFVDGFGYDQFVGIRCFGYDKVVISEDFDNGYVYVVLVWYFLLVGEIVVCVLWFVFDQVVCQ